VEAWDKANAHDKRVNAHRITRAEDTRTVETRQMWEYTETVDTSVRADEDTGYQRITTTVITVTHPDGGVEQKGDERWTVDTFRGVMQRCNPLADNFTMKTALLRKLFGAAPEDELNAIERQLAVQFFGEAAVRAQERSKGGAAAAGGLFGKIAGLFGARPYESDNDKKFHWDK
jgi:hypothetical protein